MTAILATGETMAFDKALIATGGRPIPLKLSGSNPPGVYYLRTIDDSVAGLAVGGAGSNSPAPTLPGDFWGRKTAIWWR